MAFFVVFFTTRPPSLILMRVLVGGLRGLAAPVMAPPVWVGWLRFVQVTAKLLQVQATSSRGVSDESQRSFHHREDTNIVSEQRVFCQAAERVCGRENVMNMYETVEE